MHRHDGETRVMWVAFVMITSAVAGVCVTGLFSILEAGPIASLGAGGATAIGVATIGVAVIALLVRR
ncbi:hypothetical protein GCM10009613_35920 [Pseudonocardia kongjuensis]|uniref:Uncharacterized protein n=1 Tax=Pseudonocardia kongjuensis TaxID=102227 RepID=A0ABN1XWR6_9PSEU